MKSDSIYLNNALPLTLSDEETIDLFNQMHNGIKEAREKLIVHNLRLVLYIVYNFFRNTEYDEDDLIQIGNIGLINAIDAFDVFKNIKFNTYASKCIKNEISHFMKHQRNWDKIGELDASLVGDSEDNDVMTLMDILHDDTDIEQEYDDKETKENIRNIIDRISNEKIRQIVMLYYGFYNNKIYTQQEIADIMNVSKSYISKVINNTIKQIKNEMVIKDSIVLEEQKNEQVDVNKQSIEMPVIKYDCTKILDLLSKPSFLEMTKILTARESVIVSLRLGYIDEKRFSVKQISEIFNISEIEVKETVKNSLPLYKKYLKKIQQDNDNSGLNKNNILVLKK